MNVAFWDLELKPIFVLRGKPSKTKKALPTGAQSPAILKDLRFDSFGANLNNDSIAYTDRGFSSPF